MRVDQHTPDPAVIADAARQLREGRLVAFPTETVYGLGAHALDPAAVRRLFDAKGRPANDPVIIHVANVADILPLVESPPEAAYRLAARFWPGPLTLVLRRSSRVPDEVTAGLETVAVRIPAHAVARALLEAAAIPVAAPSANLFSRPSPTRAEHVLQDLEGRIDLVVDGGATLVGVESTVLDLSGDMPVVLRPGAVTLEMLREELPAVQPRPAASPTDPSAPLRSPGLLAKHYSPRASLTLYEGEPARVLARMTQDVRAAIDAQKFVGVLIADEDALVAAEAGEAADAPRVRLIRLGPARELSIVAARLYAALRDLDAAGVDQIVVRGFPDPNGLGAAIADRLRRAAAGRVVQC